MKLADAIFAIAAVAGITLFLSFYDSAFPAAAIDLELSRNAIQERADNYVRELGIDPDTFESSLTFHVDGGAAVFLQRVLGLPETSRMAREEIALWNWRARWFRSGEKEEFILRLTPGGQPLRFSHEIPEAAAGDSLSQDSALAIATAFVTDRLAIDLAGWRLEDQSTQTRDNRLDHSFIWEKVGSEIVWRTDDPEAGEGTQRLSLGIDGSEVGSFSRYFDVPERFSREQDRETSLGNLLGLISIVFMILLVVAAMVVAVVGYKHDRIKRWAPGLVAGGAVAVALAVSGFLSFPLLKDRYETSIPFSTFMAVTIIAIVLIACVIGFAIWVSTAAGEQLALEHFPKGMKAFDDWASRRWFTRTAAVEVLRGYAIGLAFLGYITGFYIIGQKYLGVWLPAESPHSELLSMYLPWLVPLLIATQAAVSEEVIFRLFGVSFLKRHMKVTFLALLIPAMIWAFGHSTYPVYPVYVRGIELTIAGFIFGWLFINYGLLTMIIAHYAIDAFLLAMPFLGAQGGSYLGYGIAALSFALLPLAVPLVAFLRRAEPSAGDAGDAGDAGGRHSGGRLMI